MDTFIAEAQKGIMLGRTIPGENFICKDFREAKRSISCKRIKTLNDINLSVWYGNLLMITGNKKRVGTNQPSREAIAVARFDLYFQ
jgi:hypothetical protein